MYAAGGPHPLRAACRSSLELIVEKRIPLLTDSEVLQELLYRYFSIRRPDVAAMVYRSAVRICDEVLPVAERHTARALEILKQHPRASPRDAIHVATMEDGGLRFILSTDADFDAFDTVERIDPSRLPR
jgi:predicted nucleic acid-binding protein